MEGVVKKYFLLFLYRLELILVWFNMAKGVFKYYVIALWGGGSRFNC